MKGVRTPRTVLDRTAAARSRLAALLETLGQELLSAVSPLFFLLLSFAEEGGEILIAPSVTGILLVAGLLLGEHDIER